MKPIVLYSRVSTLDQNFQSQIDDLKKWATANNFKVVKSYGENVSGYDLTAERKEYDAMKAYVLEYHIKDIAVWEISRLSRSMIHTVNEIDFFTKQGINIHFKKEGIESLSNNVTNQLLITILSSMAQMERDTFIERGARGRMSSILKGNMLHSIPPYGYIKGEDHSWNINESEAKIIKLIFDLAKKGTTLYGIAQHLNSLHIPTRSTLLGKTLKVTNGKELEIKWRPMTIARYLKKTLYKGEKHFKGNIINIPAIVSSDIWENVQQRFKDKTGYINKNKHNYLFKGMIRCGRCNRLLNAITRNNTNGLYGCTGRADMVNECNKLNYISVTLIDNTIYKCLFDHKYIKEIVSRDASRTSGITEKTKQIEYFNSEIEGLRMKIKRTKQMYQNGYMEYEEFVKDNLKFNNEITDHTNKISVLKSEISSIGDVDINELIKQYKDATNFNIQREFVTKYVNGMKLYKVDGAKVNWVKPLQKNERIYYMEVLAFNYIVPMKVLFTPYTKNVLMSNKLQFMDEYNIVVDTSIKPEF